MYNALAVLIVEFCSFLSFQNNYPPTEADDLNYLVIKLKSIRGGYHTIQDSL